MTHSTTFQSKISKTKKKLSDDQWQNSAIIIAIMGLAIIVMFAARSVSLPASYGAVAAEIPLIPISIEDPGFHRYKEQPLDAIKKTTPTVILTTKAFYYGDLKSFSVDFSDTRNKFAIAHLDNKPQLASLIEKMESWSNRREKIHEIRQEDIVVVIPSGDIPMPIVIQVIDGLRNLSRYKRVVLGGGLI